MTESNVEMQLRLKKERVDQLRQEVEEKQKLIYESKGEIEALLSLLVREKDLLRGTVWVIESGLYDEWLSGDGCLKLHHSSEAIDEMAERIRALGFFPEGSFQAFGKLQARKPQARRHTSGQYSFR